jgi:hypothetical protein
MKKQTNIYWRYLAAGAAGFAGATTAQALEASDVLVFSKGPVSLRPQLEVVEQFTDNVYYNSPTIGRVSDFITILSPGLRIVAGQDLPTENHFVISYTLDDMIYAQESSQNALQHRLGTDSRIKWSRFEVEGNDRVEFLSSALGGGLTQNSRDPIDRLIIVDAYRFDYRIGERTGVYVGARHNSVDYEEGLPLFDSRRLEGTGGFEYLFSKDTRFFGEVYYGETTLTDNSPAAIKPPGTTFVGGFVGARGQFTQKLDGRVKAGYEVSTFSGGNVAAGGSKSAGEAPVVEANLSYKFTDRSKIGLTFSRRQFVSVQFVRSAYTADSVSLAASQILGSAGRLRLDGLISYQALEFEPSLGNFTARSDSNWLFNATASWYFQTWLSTHLRYSHERYSSDLPAVVDYDVNRITLSLAVGY